MIKELYSQPWSCTNKHDIGSRVVNAIYTRDGVKVTYAQEGMVKA